MKSTLIVIFCTLILGLSLRGLSGNPQAADLNSVAWQGQGPLELSPERGRFALTYSYLEDQSPFFSVDVARFAVPDLGYKNGKYVSLFAPAVSFLVMPGYLLGRFFGASQVGTFATVALFAIANVILLRLICLRLGLNPTASLIAALAFLFASPAFSYSVSLYQHHISTFLLLATIYLLLRFDNFWSLLLVWFLFAASIPVDYPNLFLLAPVAFFALSKIINFQSGSEIVVRLIPIRVLILLGAILPLLFFFWFNTISYGDPWQFSGTVGSVREIDADGLPTVPAYISKENAEKYLRPEEQNKSAVGFFNPRNQVNGLYLHLISPDRGMVYFTPVLLLAIFGAGSLYKKNRSVMVMLLAVLSTNLILYSLWGDPWGGWAFGSRYLIPSYAILAIFLGAFLTAFSRKSIVLIFTLALLCYSLAVNTAGALSTSANPPQVEVLALEKLSGQPERYSFDRNLSTLRHGNSKSFVFQTWANQYLTAWQYYKFIATSLILLLSFLVIFLRLHHWGNKHA